MKESQEENNSDEMPIIKSNSNWQPKENHHTIETFIEAIDNEMNESITKKQKLPKNNLSKDDQAALKYFANRTDLVITKADKGGATVIMDVEDYIKKANTILSETTIIRN